MSTTKYFHCIRMAFAGQIIGNTSGLKQEVIDKLLELSRNVGQPVNIVSGHDKRAGTSAHNYGLATDVYIEGYNSKKIADELARVGFTGIGVYHNKDGTPINTAHGDIRGSEAAKGTPYYKEHGHPTTWDARDIGGGPGKRKWEYTGRDWRWGKPGEAKTAEPKPASPKPALGKAGAPIKMGKNAQIFIALALLLLIIAVIAMAVGSGGGGEGGGGLAGTWVGTADFNIATDANTFDGTLEYFGYETRAVTWTITAQSGGYEIEYTYDLVSRNLQDGSMYVPDVTPIYLSGTLSGSTLTVETDGRVVGTFTLNGNTVTGTWDDDWTMLYRQRVYTDTDGLTLTKQ